MAGEQRGAPRARPWSPSWAAGPRLHSQASAALLAPYACRTSPALQLVAPQPWASASSTPLLLASPSEQHVELRAKLKSAGWAALGGGGAGAVAMVANVAALMWLRTVVQYQYRHGGTMSAAIKHLYADGGVRRFYAGVGAAMLQAPLARFGDTAANAGALALLADVDLPMALKTVVSSLAASSFRILLMPLDACKTVMQVEGKHGLTLLAAKVRRSGVPVLWAGGMGAASATAVGHYPFFSVYNGLDAYLPKYDRRRELPAFLARNAAIGFCASAVSDTVSNSLRVIKTTKQASALAISYPDAVRQVVAKDGIRGLFLRGLSTKILANGAQGILFTILWRMGQDKWAEYMASCKAEEEAAAAKRA